MSLLEFKTLWWENFMKTYYLILISLLISVKPLLASSDEIQPFITGAVPIPSAARPAAASSSDPSGTADAVPVTQHTITQKQCDTSNMIPRVFLQRMLLDPSDESGFKVEWVDDKKKDELKVVYPQFRSTCMKLEFEVSEIEGNVYLQARNIAPELKKCQSGAGEKACHDEYIECLKDKGGVDASSGQLTYNKINATVEQKFSIDKSNLGKNEEEMKVHFVSPPVILGAYGPLYGGISTSPPGLCGKVEKLHEEDTILFSSHEARVHQAYRVCRTGDPKKLRDYLEDIKGHGFDEIRKVVEMALEDYLKEEANKYQGDIRGIVDRFGGGATGDDVRANGKLLRDKLAEAEKNVVNPILLRLKELSEQLKKRGANRSDIKTRMRELGSILTDFDRAVGKGATEKMEYHGDYNAPAIMKFKLKTKMYGQQARSNAKYEQKRTEKKIEKAIRKYEDGKFAHSMDKYETREGIMNHSFRYKDRARTAKKNYIKSKELLQDDWMDAYADEKKYCAKTRVKKGRRYKRSARKCRKAQNARKGIEKHLTNLKSKTKESITLYSEFVQLVGAGEDRRRDAFGNEDDSGDITSENYVPGMWRTSAGASLDLDIDLGLEEFGDDSSGDFWSNSWGQAGLDYSFLGGGGVSGASGMGGPYQQYLYQQQMKSQMMGGANGYGGYQGYMMGGQQGYGQGQQQFQQSYPMWR